jgi:hypothetical protein
MSLSRRTFLGLVVVSCLGCDVARAASGPDEVIRAIYAFSAGKDGRWKGVSALDDASSRQAWFSDRLNAAYAEEKSLLDHDGKEMGALTFNPISNAVEGRINRLKIAVRKQNGRVARVTARFGHPDAPEQARSLVTYDLVRENDRWKVDDIVIEFEGGGCEEASTFSLEAKLRQSIDEHREEKSRKTDPNPEAGAGES